MEAIGFDIDGVLYPWVRAAYVYYQMYEGYSGSETEFFKDVNRILGEKADYIVSLPQLYTSIVPSKLILEMLSRLSERYEVFYLTYRPQAVQRVTERYFSTYKFPHEHNLIFSADKVTDARILGLTYFVEDNIKNAEKLAKVCLSFLVKTPYNCDYSGEVPVLDSVLDIERVVSRARG